MKTLRFQLGIKYDGAYQVTLRFLVLLPAILGTIPIPLAVVQVLGAAATHVPDTHLLLLRLLGLWGLTMKSETATCSSGIPFKEFRLAFKHSRLSYLAFSVGPAMRLRKNSSLFFCMISS